MPALGAGVQHEDAVGVGLGAEPGQVGEGGVRPEGVVGVVAAYLQTAAGDDEPLAGKPLGQGFPPAGRVVGGLGAGVGGRSSEAAHPEAMNSRKAVLVGVPRWPALG